MMTDLGIHHLWLFLLAGWALNLTPGPDVFYMVSSTLRGGLRAGLLAIAGILSGNIVHVLAATVGVSALIAASATAFMLLKWIGAAYLVYIGIKMLRSTMPTSEADPLNTSQKSPLTLNARSIFTQGFLSNALNPKVALFFLAFLPQFIEPQAAQATLGFFVLGLLFAVNSLPICLAYVLLAAWVSQRIGLLQRGLTWLERAAGALFVSFGIKLALSGQ